MDEGNVFWVHKVVQKTKDQIKNQNKGKEIQGLL